MTKIYLAASFEDHKKVFDIARMLKLKGHIITCDWWNHLENDMERYAKEDYDGVKQADMIVVINNGRKSTGKLVEIGLGLAWNIPIHVFEENITGVYSTMVNYHGKVKYTSRIVNKILELITKMSS
jgi:hypothetical protein